jgi:hypothetical protein
MDRIFGAAFTPKIPRDSRAGAIRSRRSRRGRPAPSMRMLASSDKQPP